MAIKADWYTAAESTADERLQELYAERASFRALYDQKEMEEHYEFWIRGFATALRLMRSRPPENAESAWDYMDRLEKLISEHAVPEFVPADCRVLVEQGKQRMVVAVWGELRRLSGQNDVPVAML